MRGRSETARLEFVSGPRALSIALSAIGTVSIGRRPTNTVVLDDPSISRDHLTIRRRGEASDETWHICDEGSRHGTRLNGVLIQAATDIPLRSGDRLAIGPWTFRVSDGRPGTDQHIRFLRTIDDVEATSSTVSVIQRGSLGSLDHRRLQLLLHGAEQTYSARDESSLTEAILNAVLSGTHFTTAAVVRSLAADGSVELLGQRSADGLAGGDLQLSRGLIRAAARGQPVQFSSAEGTPPPSQSIMQLNIAEAICVPLQTEGARLGYLYLDRRTGPGTIDASSTGAAAFAVGVGRLAALALDSLQRRQIEQRLDQVQAELAAAAQVQRMILPARSGRLSGLSYVGQCRPGRTVSGDFFDVLPLSDTRLAVTVGDVCGKGVAASVLMTTTQGFLRGTLSEHGDPQRAMRDLNQYLLDRVEMGKFVTLWIGLFDSPSQTLTFVDAGHGHAFLHDRDGTLSPLRSEGGPPVALLEGCEYQSEMISLSCDSKIVVVSDGVIEQPTLGSLSDQFGRDGLQAALNGCPAEDDLVTAVFDALEQHAGTPELADDATVLIVDGQAPK